MGKGGRRDTQNGNNSSSFFPCYLMMIIWCFWWWSNAKMGKGGRRDTQNGNNSSSFFPPCCNNSGGKLKTYEKKIEDLSSMNERDCRAVVSDKQSLENSVLQLTDTIKVIFAEFDEACKAWELERDGLFSQIVAAPKQTEEFAKSSLIAEQAWNADKENLLSSLGNTYEKKIKEMSSLNERVLLEKIELESQLNESKGRIEELLKKHDEDRYLWCSEKQNFRDNAAELKMEVFNTATERGLLCERNRMLISEVEFLKAQLAENITKIAEMQDERVQNERVLQQYRTENIDLQSNLNDAKAKTQDLLRKIEEDGLLWDAEKSNLEGTVAELRAKHELMASEMMSVNQQNKELTVDAELVKYQVNALESELKESKKRSLELLQKSEEDRHLWDEKKRNLEDIFVELQTKHENLMLQLSRKKEVEEELLATMSCLEEMKESSLKGEIEIENLRAQLLAVAEEKDGQIFDIQKQFSAMAEEKKSELATLQDRLSSIADEKKMVEEENKSLRTELDRRISVSLGEKERIECRVRKLRTTFNSINKQIDSTRAVAREKVKQFVNSQNRHSVLEEAKKCLENKNDLNRCTMGSNENIPLLNRIREFETEAESLKNNCESNDNYFQNLMSDCQSTYRKAERNGALEEILKTRSCSSRKWKIKGLT